MTEKPKRVTIPVSVLMVAVDCLAGSLWIRDSRHLWNYDKKTREGAANAISAALGHIHVEYHRNEGLVHPSEGQVQKSLENVIKSVLSGACHDYKDRSACRSDQCDCVDRVLGEALDRCGVIEED